MTKDEESRIIQAVLAGDTARFEALVREHQKGIYNHALRMLGNEQDALDASQEAFFRAYRSLRQFRGDSRFSVWLYRLTGNICIDMLRKRPPAPNVPLTGPDDELLPLPDDRSGPQEELEKQELRRLVQLAVLRLEPEFRRPLILRDVNGLSYEEIGAVTNLEPGTVKSRIHRARRKLAAMLMADGNFSALSASITSKLIGGSKGGAAK